MVLLAVARPTSISAPPNDDAFLTEVHAFLDVALTENLREAARRTLGVHTEIDACRMWHRRLFQRGWIAPAWPAGWGGGRVGVRAGASCSIANARVATRRCCSRLACGVWGRY